MVVSPSVVEQWTNCKGVVSPVKRVPQRNTVVIKDAMAPSGQVCRSAAHVAHVILFFLGKLIFGFYNDRS
jgi:hypothetical protein